MAFQLLTLSLLYFPLSRQVFRVEKPEPLTQGDRELTERSRFLSETLKYSGYYVTPHASATGLLKKHGLISTAFTPDVRETAGDEQIQQQVWTPQMERYSDRYRKILGKKGFYDEIVSAMHSGRVPWMGRSQHCLQRKIIVLIARFLLLTLARSLLLLAWSLCLSARSCSPLQTRTSSLQSCCLRSTRFVSHSCNCLLAGLRCSAACAPVCSRLLRSPSLSLDFPLSFFLCCCFF